MSVFELILLMIAFCIVGLGTMYVFSYVVFMAYFDAKMKHYDRLLSKMQLGEDHGQ